MHTILIMSVNQLINFIMNAGNGRLETRHRLVYAQVQVLDSPPERASAVCVEEMVVAGLGYLSSSLGVQVTEHLELIYH